VVLQVMSIVVVVVVAVAAAAFFERVAPASRT